MPVIGGLLSSLAENLFPNTYLPRHNILLPFYHNIDDVNPAHTRFLYDIPSIKKFTDDLDFFCRNYEPVDIDTVIRCVETGTDLSRPSFHLTFDDGFRELYDIVAPILMKKGVPATFFICSAAVDNKSLLLPNLCSLILQEAQETGTLPPEFSGQGFEQFRTHVRRLPWSENGQGQADVFRSFYKIDVEGFLASQEPFLTSMQIHKLVDQGFTFGSHSHSHMPFDRIDLSEATSQIEQSASFIRDGLHLACESFAFPFYDHNVSRNRYAALSANGIRVTFGTSAPKFDSVPFSLQRFTMNARFSKLPAKNVLGYISAKAFGNRILKRTILNRAAG